MSEQEIKTKINEIKEEMKDVHGTPCSVYSRVVGYLRPVQSFNDGKVEEFRARNLYDAGDGKEAKDMANLAHAKNMQKMSDVKCFRGCK